MANLEESVKIDQLLRKEDNRIASFQLIGIETSSDGSSSISLPNGTELEISQEVGYPPDGSPGDRYFAVPQVSVYESSIADANRIPDGDNINPTDYEFTHWVDWGSTSIDEWEISFKTVILNKSGSTQTVLYRGNVRRIIKGN